MACEWALKACGDARPRVLHQWTLIYFWNVWGAVWERRERERKDGLVADAPSVAHPPADDYVAPSAPKPPYGVPKSRPAPPSAPAAAPAPPGLREEEKIGQR